MTRPVIRRPSVRRVVPPLAGPATALGTALLVLVGGCSPSSGGRMAEGLIIEQVTESVNGLFAAMNAGDVDGLLAYYSESPGFISAGISEVVPSREVFAGRARVWYPANPEVQFTHELVGVRPLAPTVALTVIRGGSTTAPFLLWTQTWVLEEDGIWRIAAEHESWPDCGEPIRPHSMTGEGLPEGSGNDPG
jgi:hypothetical protein